MNNLYNNNMPIQGPMVVNVGNPQHYGAPRIVNRWLAANQGPLDAFANIALGFQDMNAGNDHNQRPGV